MIYVEASPWRLARGDQASAWRRFQALIGRDAEPLAPFRSPIIAFFTHEGYRRDLLPQHPERGHVIHASWIDEAVVLSAADAARARWQARVTPTAPLRLLLAGQPAGGQGHPRPARCAGAAARAGADAGRGGDHRQSGPLQRAVPASRLRRSDDHVRLEVLEPVSYGEPLFALLRGFDALLVPSLADEQPRVVYDAYSQALPVLAAATPGLSTCVCDGGTGLLFAPASATALADTIAAVAREPAGAAAAGAGSAGGGALDDAPGHAPPPPPR